MEAQVRGAAPATGVRARTSAGRGLSGEKVQRIVSAMRDSVAERGIAGSTFEHVSREAGVSRGLLHYYFGTKERLLVEVLRHDVELRIAALDAALAPAATVDDVIAVLVASLEDLVQNAPGLFGLILELFTEGRHNEEIRRQLAEHYQRSRDHVARLLREKEREGVLAMRLDAAGDGAAIQMLADPERDHAPMIEVAVEVARSLLSSD